MGATPGYAEERNSGVKKLKSKSKKLKARAVARVLLFAGWCQVKKKKSKPKSAERIHLTDNFGLTQKEDSSVNECRSDY